MLVIVDMVYQELLCIGLEPHGDIALSPFPMNFVLKGVLMIIWGGDFLQYKEW